MRTALTLVALLLTGPRLAAAQASAEPSPRPAERLVGGWIGASVAPSTRFGYVDDRHFFVAALRAQYLLDTFGPLELSSTVDVVPLAILSNTPTYRDVDVYSPGGGVLHFKGVTGRSPVFGAGILPAGLQFRTRSTHPARFFAGAAAGLLWFTRDTPVPDARRMNVALDAGGGAELVSRDGRVIVIAYKFQHLSNGGTARQNPGVDAHLVYVGVMRRQGRRGDGHEETGVAR